jgi:GT2 family glycosyltransferase
MPGLSKPKVLVAVLCGPERYQWIAPGLTLRLIEATQTPGLDVHVAAVYGAYGYAMARNRAVEMFLESDNSVLWMVDNDTTPPADFVSRVLEFEKADVVALPYYMRPDGVRKASSYLCIGWRASEQNFFHMPLQLEHKWQEVDVGGAGCMFIRRAVLERMAFPWFQIPEHAIEKRFLAGACEDFDFCERAQAAGFHIWTHGGLLCGHLHTVDLSVVAEEIVVRRETDIQFLRSLGLNVPTMKTVGPSRSQTTKEQP